MYITKTKFFIILFIISFGNCKNCVRDTSGCPFTWIPSGNSCVSPKGDKIAKLSDLSQNTSSQITLSNLDKNKSIDASDVNGFAWPCNDGEAILSELLAIEVKPWTGLLHSGPVNPHDGNVVSL